MAAEQEPTAEQVQATKDLMRGMKNLADGPDTTDAHIRAALLVAALEGVPTRVVAGFAMCVGLVEMDVDVLGLVQTHN